MLKVKLSEKTRTTFFLREYSDDFLLHENSGDFLLRENSDILKFIRNGNVAVITEKITKRADSKTYFYSFDNEPNNSHIPL